MRNITAKELLDLMHYHAKEGNEELSLAYLDEEKKLRAEMNRD